MSRKGQRRQAGDHQIDEEAFKWTRIAGFSLLPSVRDMSIRLQMQRLVAETDRWCWKAIARGVGYRVWRSDAVSDDWPSTKVTYQFQILAPGEPPPGSGTVFGPFST